MTEPRARPRILLVTRNLPPLVGGMERLNEHLVNGLARWASIDVVGPAGCSASINARRVDEVRAGPLSRFLPAAAVATVAAAVRTRPDLVIAGSGLTLPIAKAAAATVRAPCVVYLHGLDLVVANALYQALWLPAIRRADLAIANSRNTRDLALARGVEAARVAVVNPGTELPLLQQPARERFRSRFDLSDAPVLLSVGRLTARKGLAEFVAKALPAIRALHPGVTLVVIGNEAPDALHRQGGGVEELLAVAEAAGVRPAIRALGTCDDATLQDAYAAADLHVFPLKDIPGDVEGFGMVAIEAAAQGLATIAFEVGGVADAVVPGTGELLPPADYGRLAETISRWLEEGYDRARCRQAAARFCWDRFDAEVRVLVEPLVNSSMRRKQRC